MSKALFPGRRVRWMPLDVAWTRPTRAITHCCASMAGALDFQCDQHASPFECRHALLVYNEVMNEYGLIIHDGTASYLLIDSCPWCGTGLPESVRDKWYDAIDALELPDDVGPPPAFQTSAWRQSLKIGRPGQS